MKHRMSISLDEETIALVQGKLCEDRDFFRNKSHLVEFTVKNMFKQEKNN